MHVLRNVHRSLRPQGLLLDIHPRAEDTPMRANGRGVGFVDARRFAPLVAVAEDGLDDAVRDGLFRELRREGREIVERYDSADELLEAVDEWDNLRLPASARRRIRAGAPPFDLLWPITFRLLRKTRPRRREDPQPASSTSVVVEVGRGFVA